MATETRAHAKCRSPSTLRASAHTDVEWAKFKFVMYSVLRDPAVCVLPGGDYRKLVDGSAFATDINHDRQPYNVFVVDDDDARQDYGIGPVLHAHRNKILDASNSSRSCLLYTSPSPRDP